jgi:hypothetical protein
MQKTNKFFNKIKNANRNEWLIWSASFAVILAGFSICYLLYAAHRSLWIDEAMLAVSFSKRSIWELASSKFEWNQSAPILYLYIVKIITLLFGNTEFTLRIFSFFAYMGTLIMSYLLLQKAFKVKYPIIGVAFISTMQVLLYYTNEFKPYMNDCLCVLMVIFIYYLYNQNKIRFSILVVIYSAILWLSYPTIFFVAAVLIYEAVMALLIKRDLKQSIIKVIGGLTVLSSFIIHYFIWLKPVADYDGMIDFWVDYKFPLIPTSIDSIQKAVWLISGLFQSMEKGILLILILMLMGIIISILEKNKYAISLVLGVFFSLLASYIGKYPFHFRLMLFIFPIVGLFVFILLDRIMKTSTGHTGRILAIGLTIAVLASNYASADYLKPAERYIPREEANSLISYLDRNIQEGETLYVNRQSIPVFSYKNGYDNFHIGRDVASNEFNVVHGRKDFSAPKNRQEIEKVLAYESCYLLCSHYKDPELNPLLNALKDNGYLELIKNRYDTRLYFYTSSLDKIKTSATAELLSYSEDDSKGLVKIKITNTGSSVFNAYNTKKMYLASKDHPNIRFEIKKSGVVPGKSFIVQYNFTWPDDCDTMDIQLLKIDEYWFDEIGIEPITIYRN